MVFRCIQGVWLCRSGGAVWNCPHDAVLQRLQFRTVLFSYGPTHAQHQPHHLQSLRHPRHRRKNRRCGNRTPHRPRFWLRSTRQGRIRRRHRSRWPLVWPGTARSAGRRPARERRRCDRFGSCGHADGLLWHKHRAGWPSRHVGRDGHGQPQSARLQRLQDGAGGPGHLWRSNPGAAHAHRAKRFH